MAQLICLKIHPTMNIILRPYQTTDTAAILEIINYNILNSTALYDYNTRTLEQQQALLNDKIKKGFPVIVAENDGDLVGFGMYAEFRFREANQFTVEHSVYVDHLANGKGIGKLLLAELIRLAREQGMHTMIGVIDTENKGSVVFHEKFGFKTSGVIREVAYKFDRWLDTVFMQLMLK